MSRTSTSRLEIDQVRGEQCFHESPAEHGRYSRLTEPCLTRTPGIPHIQPAAAVVAILPRQNCRHCSFDEHLVLKDNVMDSVALGTLGIPLLQQVVALTRLDGVVGGSDSDVRDWVDALPALTVLVADAHDNGHDALVEDNLRSS